MHMADALLSPAVGGTLWAATAGTIAWCSRRLKQELDDSRIPLMGVLAAFIFAAQMINFTIPGTGSSGHLGGGMILAILLGPYAGFLAMASVLTVQALFFADGGLLALGCNIFNLGFFPCFVAYPFIYRPLVGKAPTPRRVLAGACVAAVAGLQLGAFSVVLETLLSGVSALPFGTFALLMQPIHLAIGLVEGAVTAAVITFIGKARPELLAAATVTAAAGAGSIRRIVLGVLLATLVTGGMLSWFASSHPDGLEWALAKSAGPEAPLAPPAPTRQLLDRVQEKTALLPGYQFRASADVPGREEKSRAATSVAGMVGGGLTLLLAVGLGWLLRRRRAVAPKS
ncbi:energy-coupling factor ABC transporter permease [Desulfuromonas carbonis]